jgi:hypothetical protein
MDKQTKHEIAVITSCMLAAIPIFGSLRFVVVAGLLAWWPMAAWRERSFRPQRGAARTDAT